MTGDRNSDCSNKWESSPGLVPWLFEDTSFDSRTGQEGGGCLRDLPLPERQHRSQKPTQSQQQANDTRTNKKTKASTHNSRDSVTGRERETGGGSGTRKGKRREEHDPLRRKASRHSICTYSQPNGRGSRPFSNRTRRQDPDDPGGSTPAPS